MSDKRRFFFSKKGKEILKGEGKIKDTKLEKMKFKYDVGEGSGRR